MIQLSLAEKNIIQTLLGCINKQCLKVTCRIAGGWVRDKLLGMESDDIDVALDTMTGEQFASHLSTYLSHVNLKQATIKSNPEKSKHLETTTLTLFSHHIDFVNLRKESYSDSRIPSVEFGTPLVDAERRDITINALFYNIHSSKVEDWTGKGLMDLKERRIRTPLDPVTTFLDDPLRMLRVVRFAARLDFQLDKNIIPAMKLASVREAFKTKLSRERILTELDKIFKGPNVHFGLKILVESGIFELIFDECDTRIVLLLAEKIVKIKEMKNDCDVDSGATVIDGETSTPANNNINSIWYFCCCVAPFKNDVSIISSILSRIGLKTKEFKLIIHIFNCMPRVINFYNETKDSIQVSPGKKRRMSMISRAKVGSLVRELDAHWMCIVIFTMMAHNHDLAIAYTIIDMVQDMNLEDCHRMVPLVNGHEIIQLFGIKGKDVGVAKEQIIKWQLEHPSGTREDVVEYLKKNWSRN